MLKKPFAEFIGTFILVFFGVGSAVLMGDQIGFHGIAVAFGLSIVAAAYGIGAISGAHLNPAVSLGFLVSGQMPANQFITHVIAQIAGAIVGALVIYTIANGNADYDIAVNGLGANGWGEGYNGGYGTGAAFIFELVATFIFVTVILGATGPGSVPGFAGLAIGLTLTGIHLVGINVTGVSVNPARSIGPALFVGSSAMSQLWLFLVAPLAGGALAGLLHAAGATRAD